MREKIIEILSSTIPGIDFANAKDLIDEEVIGSLDMVAIVGEFISEFDVELSVDDIIPDNFNSVDAMAAMIEAKKA